MTRRVTLARVARAGLVVLVGVATARAAGAQQPAGSSAVRQPTVYESLQMFSQVLNQIRVNHPDSLDTHVLLQAAVRGLVRAADPHSYVIPALRLDREREAALREGKLHPVPIEFAMVDDAATVIAVAPGSSAAREGILGGDELVSADGAPIRAESATEVDVLLAGPKGSSVKLGFHRRRSDGTVAEFERTVKRGYVEGASPVPSSFMLDSATGYVRIVTFADDRAADHLHAALERLEKQGMQRLMLDLRDNGGGSVAEAEHIAGEFLPKGAVVYTSTGRKRDVTDTGRVSRSFWRSERRYPVAVLINEGTASASELVAGALQDHDRATIIGRPSFGKALLMRGFPLTDGSVIMLVVGHVRTPCGRVVQRQYRDISRRDYIRLAGAPRDTADLPRCRTASGRTVYGGGGIHPDITLGAPTELPAWLARAWERALPLRWATQWMEANRAALTSPETFATSPGLAAALPAFRALAAAEGVEIPTGEAIDLLLVRTLAPAVAAARWDEAARFRVEAALDPEVAAALAAFAQR